MKIMTRPGIVQEAIRDLRRAGLAIEPRAPSRVGNVSAQSEPALLLSRPMSIGIGRGATSRTAVADVLAPQTRRPAIPIAVIPGSARTSAASQPSTPPPAVQRIMDEIRTDQLRAAQHRAEAHHAG